MTSTTEAARGAKVALLRDASEAYAALLRPLNPDTPSDARLILSLYAAEARQAMGTV